MADQDDESSRDPWAVRADAAASGDGRGLGKLSLWVSAVVFVASLALLAWNLFWPGHTRGLPGTLLLSGLALVNLVSVAYAYRRAGARVARGEEQSSH